MDGDEIPHRLREMGVPARLASELEAGSRVGAVFRRVVDSSASNARTWAWGAPLVDAVDFRWPQSVGGIPMKFVVQLDLSELPVPVQHAVGLPGEGLLSLFLSGESLPGVAGCDEPWDSHCRVKYSRDVDALSLHEPPYRAGPAVKCVGVTRRLYEPNLIDDQAADEIGDELQDRATEAIIDNDCGDELESILVALGGYPNWTNRQATGETLQLIRAGLPLPVDRWPSMRDLRAAGLPLQDWRPILRIFGWPETRFTWPPCVPADIILFGLREETSVGDFSSVIVLSD